MGVGGRGVGGAEGGVGGGGMGADRTVLGRVETRLRTHQQVGAYRDLGVGGACGRGRGGVGGEKGSGGK